MLMRFVACTLGRNLGPAETDALLTRAFEQLATSWPGLTKRALDHRYGYSSVIDKPDASRSATALPMRHLCS